MEKPRPLRPTFGSSNGKEVVGSSSVTSSGMTTARRSGKESHKKYSSNIEDKRSDTSSLRKESQVLKQMQSSTERQFQFDSAKRDTDPAKLYLQKLVALVEHRTVDLEKYLVMDLVLPTKRVQ